MLGLGDIVIPGIFVAILLRYDALNGFRTRYFHRYGPSQTATSFTWQLAAASTPSLARPKDYMWSSFYTSFMTVRLSARKFFWCGNDRILCPCSTFAGYVLGLTTTIVVMNVFEAAQPALLYLVPAIISAAAIHSAVKGEFKEVVFLYKVKEQHYFMP